MKRREVIWGGGALALVSACHPVKTPSSHESSLPLAPESLSLEEKRSRLSGFAVNIESWWRDLPFEDRFAKAAEAGFEHVEFWFISSWDRDVKKLAAAARSAEVKVAQIVGDAPALASAAPRDVFLDNMKIAIEEAKLLGTDIVTITGHKNVEGISKEDALKFYLNHVAASAPLWEAAEVYCAIEPFNPYDHPGHFINGSVEAVEICRQINSPFIKLNWDLFHMQRAEGNVIDNLKKGADQICYMQMADSPDRHQPGTGEMDYANIIRAARSLGYNRPIGLELWAKEDDYARALRDILLLAQSIDDAT